MTAGPGDGMSTAGTRARALAALGALNAMGVEGIASSSGATLAARLAGAAKGPLPWSVSTASPLDGQDQAAVTALAEAWATFLTSRREAPLLEVRPGTLGGGALFRLARELQSQAVGARGMAVVRTSGAGAPRWSTPLRLGVFKDAHLCARMAEGLGDAKNVTAVAVADDRTAVDLLVLPQPPPRPDQTLGMPPVSLAAGLIALDDPRAPVDLTADYLWAAFNAAPSPLLALAPMNGKEIPGWAAALAGLLGEGASVAEALCRAQPRFGQPCLVLAPASTAWSVPKG